MKFRPRLPVIAMILVASAWFLGAGCGGGAINSGTSYNVTFDGAAIPVEERVSSVTELRRVLDRRLSALGFDTYTIDVVAPGTLQIKLPNIYLKDNGIALVGLRTALAKPGRLEFALLPPDGDAAAATTATTPEPAVAVSTNNPDSTPVVTADPVVTPDGATITATAGTPATDPVVTATPDAAAVAATDAPAGYRRIDLPAGPDGVKPAPLFVSVPPAPLTAKDLKRTDAYETSASVYALAMQFNDAGAAALETFTRENRGRKMAIMIDDQPCTIATIGDPITGGKASVAGQFTEQAAQFLTIQLSSGSLPITIQVSDPQPYGKQP